MQEKTEKPSLKKLKRAKEKGEVAKSFELASALILFCSIAFLWLFNSYFEKCLKNMFVQTFSYLSNPKIIEIQNLIKPLMYLLLLTLGSFVLIALFAHTIQTGWLWNWPKKSGRQGFRWILISVKLALASLISYLDVEHIYLNAESLVFSSADKISFFYKSSFYLAFKICTAFLLLGLLDYGYQRWKYYKKMHMTHQELKGERRATEGDLETKKRMRQR